MRVRIEANKEWDNNQFAPNRSLTRGEQRKVDDLMENSDMTREEAEIRVRKEISEAYVSRDFETHNVDQESSLIEKIIGEDIFQTGQPWFGNWVPHGSEEDPNYLDLGWTGYHVIIKKTQNKRHISYS